jgi:catechol 2,3-dioxygenase-like lactoylglutathione lyase family enzyme
MNSMPHETSLQMTVPLEVGIGCHDLAVMRRFYEQTLGLQFVSELRVPAQTAQRYRLARGDATVLRLQTSSGERLKLIAPDDAPALPDEQPGYVFDRPNVTYLTFIIADIHAVTRRVLAQGGSAMSGETPIEGRPGLFVVFLRDPEGNIVELVQYDDVAAYRQDLAQRS